jgi:hypothetical protein
MRNGFITADQLRWIMVDMDLTLCNNTGEPDFTPTTIIPGAKEAMQELVRRGWKIIIFTARHWGEYQIIENWLLKNEIPFKQIICGKPLVRWIIDDRAIGFEGDWKAVLDKIK